MKLYTVQPINWRYDDEYYNKEGLEAPLKVFRKKENADALCLELNEKMTKEWAFETYNGVTSEYYVVTEVESDLDQVEPAPGNEKGYKELLKDYLSLEDELSEKAKVAFEKGCVELFNANKRLESFSFRSYTDYFNDGDACYHSAHTDPDAISVNESEYYEAEENLAVIVSKFLREFRDEDYLSMFGDHVEVVVERGKKIKVNRYTEHD